MNKVQNKHGLLVLAALLGAVLVFTMLIAFSSLTRIRQQQVRRQRRRLFARYFAEGATIEYESGGRLLETGLTITELGSYRCDLQRLSKTALDCNRRYTHMTLKRSRADCARLEVICSEIQWKTGHRNHSLCFELPVCRLSCYPSPSGGSPDGINEIDGQYHRRPSRSPRTGSDGAAIVPRR